MSAFRRAISKMKHTDNIRLNTSKNKWMTYSISALIISMTILLFQIISPISFVKGEVPQSPEYVITIDQTKGWPSYTGSGYKSGSKNYRYVIMNFVDYIVNSNPNNLQLKANSGSIINNETTPITGLKSIRLTYSSETNMLVYYGNSASPSSNYKSCPSNTTIDFSDVSANYIKIITGSKYATMTSAVITYSCVDDPGTPDVPVTEITLSGTATIQVDGTTQLTANISPQSATDKSLVWSSLQPSIAEVSTAGLVTGIATGTATIRATNVSSGVYGQLEVIVTTSFEGPKVASWDRVTNVDELVSGDTYAFVYMTASTGKIASNTIGSGSYLSSNNFVASAISVEAESYPSTLYGWELGGTTNAWTFSNGSGYLYSSSATNLGISLTLNTKTWKISLTSGDYASIANTTVANGSLQYNITHPRFNSYSSTQASIYLYKYIDGGPRPVTIEVTDNSDYKITDIFDFNDFIVDITYSDNTTLANVPYDSSGIDGFYFGEAFDPDEQQFDIATPFVLSGYHAIEIYYRDINGECDDMFFFNVKGGSAFDDTLVDLQAIDESSSYSIGNVYEEEEQLTVTATWENYGIENIEKGDGNDGYAIFCSTHDLTMPFTESGIYIVTVSYRTLTVDVEIDVVVGYQKQTLDYNYEDLFDNNVYVIDAMPSKESPKVLVIPTKFTDTSLSSSELTNYRNKIEKAFFGTDEETGWKSVKTYFEDSSYNKLSITGTVTEWWNSGYSSSQVNSSSVTTTLVKNAVSWYKANNSDATSFDTNNDGYLDAVCLIYGAENYYDSGSSNDNLWAYCFWVQELGQKNIANPGPNVFFWASYDFMEQDTRYAAIDTHTYIHEMGHIFGLDDYYNYDEFSNDGSAGGFLMQDYNVGDHDPYSKMALGWIDPLVPTDTTTITLRPYETSGDVILLTPSFSNSPFDEYIVLDFYTATGLNYFDSRYRYSDAYPIGTTNKGIRAWHVDARLFKTPTRTTNFTTSTPLSTSIDSDYYYYHAMSNSTDSNYGSFVSSYRNYRLLHLLQAGGTNTFKDGFTFSSSDLFKAGDSFSMASYNNFFYNSGKLNSNMDLGWSFSVVSITDSEATILITKL
jgi:M6 family metalloprotease-like protein